MHYLLVRGTHTLSLTRKPYAKTPDCVYGCGSANDVGEADCQTQEWSTLDAFPVVESFPPFVSSDKLSHVSMTVFFDWNDDGLLDIVVAFNKAGDSSSVKRKCLVDDGLNGCLLCHQLDSMLFWNMRVAVSKCAHCDG